MSQLSRIGLDKRIAAHTLLKMLREAGYDGSLAHPAAFHDFSYLKFTELLMDYCAASEKQAPLRVMRQCSRHQGIPIMLEVGCAAAIVTYCPNCEEEDAARR